MRFHKMYLLYTFLFKDILYFICIYIYHKSITFVWFSPSVVIVNIAIDIIVIIIMQILCFIVITFLRQHL